MKIQQFVRRFRFMDENVDAAAAGGGTGEQQVSGGVGNGQATGTGDVSENFDTAAAIDSIGADLFGGKEEGNKDSATAPSAASAPTAAGTTAEADAAAKAAADAEAASKAAVAAPKTWKPEEQATWAQIPEAAKAAILRREEDIYKGIEQYKAPAEFGAKVQKTLDPYIGIMRQHNMDPVETIGNLLNAHHTLAMGSPLQKQAFLHDLAKQYGIAIAAPEADAFGAVEDPEVIRLREELHVAQSSAQALERQRYEEVQSKLTNEVNAFAADPKNVHFDKVADLMIPLLKDKSVTLAQAYEKAMWLHPEVRELEIARINAEKHAKAIADGKAAADAARKAQAVNVKVGPKAGAATSPLGSMEDTMAETLKALKGR